MPVPPASSPPPLSSVRAWTYLGINLLATPGLGSVMGGRKVAGRGQLFFSVTGFFLIVIWMFKLSFSIMEAGINGTDSAPVPAWWWQLGVLCFGIGWLWSLGTSISLLRQVKREAARKPFPTQTRVPPRLDDWSRPKPPKL